MKSQVSLVSVRIYVSNYIFLPPFFTKELEQMSNEQEQENGDY